MKLSRLHINGFKSFPDRAELGFDHGVTAIVGPNGCGKSNVVDAITWVLGEQSAKSLRGERMEDVIFSGSDGRKPTAAAEVRLKLTQVAQAAMGLSGGADAVDLLLDDQPLVTRDVEIGRRLYRSGESEYLINGEICRLKDVHDLLMDSGLGVKAYAVIEQGKIGQILASRPAERRTLIEEAAGVTKYKSRRRAAELKLVAAQQNLTRIDDIIFEVEKQRGALRRQAARARRYRRLREELRRWEQVQFARRHEALAREIEQAETVLTDARTRQAGAAGHLAELEAALESVRLGLTEAEAGATATREDAHARELQIERRQQQIQFDRQQIDDLAAQAQAFGAEVEDLEARREPAQRAVETKRDAAASVREALAAASGRVEACQADYREALTRVQETELDSDGTRATVLASTTTLAALRQARDHASAARDRVAAERERLDLEARELDGEAEKAAASLAQVAAALTERRRALDETVAVRAQVETDLASRRAERQRLTDVLSIRQRELAGSEARLRSLEELEARRATFGDAARFLLAGEPTPQRHGAVADHLQVERSYERAVDALLGDLLEHVLVESPDDVVTALERLGSQDVGRCGFVVLQAVVHEGGEADPPLVVPPGARPLGAVVRATGPYADVVGRLIGRALIVDSFDEARRLAATMSVPVATRAGEVFRGAWRVEGGSRKDVRGILESRAEMISLRERVESVGTEVRELQHALLAADAAIAEAETRLATMTTDQHGHEKAIVGLEAQQAQTVEARQRLGRRLELVSTERGRADEEARAAESRRDEAMAAITAREQLQRDAEGKLEGVLARLQAARELAEDRLRLVTEARTEQAGLTERSAALDAEVARLEEAGHDLEARIEARRQDIGRTESRREELRGAIAANEQRLDEDVEALNRFRELMRGHDERVVELRTDFTAREHEIRSARQQLESVRAEVMESELVRAKAISDRTNLESSCLEVTGRSLEEVASRVADMDAAGELAAPGRRVAAAAAPEADEEADEAGESPEPDQSDDMEARPAAEPGADAVLQPDEVIAHLKRSLERLGPVNMMAIEQFDELEARHTFLTSQRQDLLDSIAQTGEAIRKIDKTTRERFAAAFESINAHFEQTFTTLFGGGRAGLVLIDQENDPESGVDIIAQPPGKRLQNVQLLSGGEKALTAMALMFAIFKHRPSPFCLLDEIDAPLDDANIGRFVEMLQGMQDHTQFILVTHNRKTMEIADRMYGVTMEEPGVSKLISLQLN